MQNALQITPSGPCTHMPEKTFSLLINDEKKKKKVAKNNSSLLRVLQRIPLIVNKWNKFWLIGIFLQFRVVNSLVGYDCVRKQNIRFKQLLLKQERFFFLSGVMNCRVIENIILSVCTFLVTIGILSRSLFCWKKCIPTIQYIGMQNRVAVLTNFVAYKLQSPNV